MRWVDAGSLAVEDAARDALRDWLLEHGAEAAFDGAKLDGRGLSPGCRSCGEGTWSCLFVSGRCNAGCFYCPAPQDEEGVPTTAGLSFTHPEEYAEYVQRLGFRGVGLSGGEPLVTPERTLAFARAVKTRLGDQVHLWMYTNGRLATRERLEALARAGLDEIRFDVTAGVARPGAIEDAVRLLPRVTAEIPAVPGDMEALVALARSLADRGVRHLNLHQLRATPHNVEALIARGLEFRGGDAVLVVGSENTALGLVRRAILEGIPIAVNACTWRYKSAAQLRGARLRAAPFVRRPYEEIDTEGLLHWVEVGGPAGEIAALCRVLLDAGISAEADAAGTRARLAPAARARAEAAGFTVREQAADPRVVSRLSFRAPFAEIRLSTGRKIAVEKRPLPRCST